MLQPALIALLAACAAAVAAALTPVVPATPFWGVNIHFTSARAGEAAYLAQAFNAVRMDFSWSSIEKTKGVYDFAAYDTLLREMAPNNVTLYLILDYANPLYDSGLAPHTPAGISAFAAWATASVAHFQGQGIVWELWNEPNGLFWTPWPNATAYGALAVAVGASVKQHFPKEVLIGPATFDLDINFLTTVFEAGALMYFDAVSNHMYRNTAPETVIADYATLQALIDKYTPAGRGKIPIVSGEWGWTTCDGPWPGCNGPIVTVTTQAKFLARRFLVDRFAGVQQSIYYDWVNDGTDVTQRESNFGTNYATYYNASYPYQPKPAFIAARVLRDVFGAGIFDSALDVKSGAYGGSNWTFAFGFRHSPASQQLDRIAVWSAIGASNGQCGQNVLDRIDCGFFGISQSQCEARGCCFETPYVSGPQCYFHSSNVTHAAVVALPGTLSPSACFHAVSYLGEPQPSYCAQGGLLAVPISDAPLYLLSV